MNDCAHLVESGRAIMASPRLGRAERVSLGPQDEKFALGDLLAHVADEELDAIAGAIGHNLSGAGLRSYREVARAWPWECRVAASWTVHRTLKNAANRFDLIQPGMTLREAVIATGKNPADTEHPSRWNIERRVPFIISQLQDEATVKAIRAELDGRKRTRSAKAALKMVEEDRSAEYRDALRELREVRDAKHPERAAYEALFRIRDAREYVRAVGKATADQASFMPAHRRPELIAAVRDLALTSIQMIASLSGQEESAVEVLAILSRNLQALQPQQISTTFEGIVIPGEVDNSSARSAATLPLVDDGRA